MLVLLNVVIYKIFKYCRMYSSLVESLSFIAKVLYFENLVMIMLGKLTAVLILAVENVVS